jgi:glycosyltransferase involved in cell wall biosynthesis
MPNLPEISVILPIYNGEQYLEEALASILEQDFRSFEVLAINDGSIDGTGAILERMSRQDNRIRILSRENAGLVSALNWGLAEAKADIIARMDADDISYSNRFSIQRRFLENNPDVGLVFTQMRKIDDQGAPVQKVTNTPLSAEEIAKALKEGNCLPHHPTVMARKSEMQAAGGYREVFKGAEDLDLWYRMSKKTKLVGLSDVLLDYRLHTGQVTQRNLVRQRFSQDMIILIAREIEADRPDPSQSWTTPPEFSWSSNSPELSNAPNDILTLFRTYSIIDQILNQEAIDALPSDDLSFLLDIMIHTRFFSSAKSRQLLSHHLVQEAKQRELKELRRKAMIFAFKLNPSRALRHKFKPF